MIDTILTDTIKGIDSLIVDSIPAGIADTLTTTSAGTELPMLIRAESLATSSWFALLLIFILVALATSISVHRKQYSLLLRNVMNKEGRVMSYDSEHTEVWANILLATVVILCHSMCIFSIAQIKMQTQYPVWVFIGINIIILLHLLIKWIAAKTTGYIFSMQDKTSTFIKDYLVIISIWGLLLIPCAIGLVYSSLSNQNIWIFVVFALSVFVFITILVKLVQIFYQGIGSLFYIFLYLCTLEILPISIVLKIASKLITEV